MSPDEPTRYAESLAFLLSQVGARSAQIFARRLVPMGVSPRAYGVLSNLVNAGGQTQQQLADKLGIHRNNMVGLIDDLQAVRDATEAGTTGGPSTCARPRPAPPSSVGSTR